MQERYSVLFTTLFARLWENEFVRFEFYRLKSCQKFSVIIIPSMYLQIWSFLVAQMVKNLPAMWETWVRSLGWEDLLENGMAVHSSMLAWRIPQTEEPGRLQFIGSQRVRHDWATKQTHTQIQRVFYPLLQCTGQPPTMEPTLDSRLQTSTSSSVNGKVLVWN